MANTDKTLQCVDCGASFTFTAEEQDFFATKGFTNEPKRCLPCRQSRRQRRPSSEGGATTDSPRRERFTAVCAACGKEAQVPFQPTEGRPVYCSECFTKTRRPAPVQEQPAATTEPAENLTEPAQDTGEPAQDAPAQDPGESVQDY